MSKALLEKRADLQNEMESLLNTAKEETRAMSEEEITKFDALEKEIREIDSTLEREEKIRMEEKREIKETKEELTVEQRDYNDFAEYVRASAEGLEMRADVNMTKGSNGAVIPKTIVNKIMEKVAEISPVYARATKYNAKGTLAIPCEDTTTKITVAYGTEFTDLESSANNFTTIELTGFLYGALTKISKSLLNNTNFDLVNWVIDKMAKKIAQFLEGELLNGSTSKVSGIIGSYDSTGMKVALASKTAVTSDELIELQDKVPDAYQGNACWIMNKATRLAVRKLKDGQGNYLLQRDFSQEGAYTLLGKPVFCSDNMTALGTANKSVIVYGDISGLAVKESETPEVQVLREKYATQHAIGVVMWGEVDAKVENTQKIAVAVTPAS